MSLAASEPCPPGANATAHGEVVAVAPDVSGIDRHFDYIVPRELGDLVPGTIVRVPLGPRRVRAWVLGAGETAPSSPELRPVAEVVSLGPSAEVLDLAGTGADRYAGWLRPFLLAASPPRRVGALGPGARPRPLGGPVASVEITSLLGEALANDVSVVRLPPARSRLEVVTAVLGTLEAGRDLLVLVAERRDVEILRARLERLGIAVAGYPEDWAAAAAGGRVVVGTRNAVFASAPRLGAIVVLDAHEESYVSERAPTWRAPVLAVERARRAGIACILVSSCPDLELCEGTRLVTLAPVHERAGWAPLEILDRRGDDPRSGLYATGLAEIIHGARRSEPGLPVVCVLNRAGRARLLACGSCGEVVACEVCGAALGERASAAPGEARVLSCPACRFERPAVCASCGARRLKLVRIGVARAREELEALLGLEVAEVSAAHPDPRPGAGVVVGTEAVLHRLRSASLVVFLDFDQHLLAARYRAAEQALALLARAARLVVARHGRLVVQTRLAGSPVLEAVRRADPGILAAAERERRRALRLPPFAALATLRGEGVQGFVEERCSGLEVAAREDGEVLVRAADHEELLNALGARGLVPGVRIAVDPLEA